MTEIFGALSHENRLKLIALLSDQPLCVCDLETNLNMSQSNVSKHLGILKNAKIIKSFKTQQWVYYAINQDFVDLYPLLWEHLKLSFERLPYVHLRQQCCISSQCTKPVQFSLKHTQPNKEVI
jgi:ArsR family transcriptional regulator, arsenate/arsenite/antimonite-responsive transcriptional repressor